MELKFKRLSDKAVMPIKIYTGDAGLDLTCISIEPIRNECNQLLLRYHTGLAVEIPEGYVGLLFPRSSICNTSLIQSNCVGVIDSGYRGEIKVVFRNTTDVIPAVYKEGERFCQLVIVKIPDIQVVEAAELSKSTRGTKGYGSTGDSHVDPEGSTQDKSSADEAVNDDLQDSPAVATEGGVAETTK